MTCGNQLLYSRQWPVLVNNNQEQRLANDTLNAGAILVQNNSQYEVNVLLWRDVQKSGAPIEIALRSGGSLELEAPVGAYEVWASLMNPLAFFIQPAGYDGQYKGAGAILPNDGTLYGYLSVMAWSEHVQAAIRDGDMQRVDYNQRPLTNWTLPDGMKMNYYKWSGNFNSTTSTMHTTQNTLEQVVDHKLLISSKIAGRFQLSVNANSGKPDQVNNVDSYYFNAGDNQVIELSGAGYIPDNFYTTPNLEYGLPKGTVFKAGGDYSYMVGWQPHVTSILRTIVLQA